MDSGYQKSWWLALIALGVQQAVGTAIGILTMLLGISYLYPVLIFGSASLLIPILIGSIWVWQAGGKFSEIMPMKATSIRMVPYFVLLPVMIQHFVSYATLPLNGVFSILFGAAQEGVPAPHNIGSFLLTFLGICVAAPLFEEILCRGVIMRLLKPYGFLVSVLVSAALFATLHMEIQSILPIFFIGTLFGVVRYATGSILPCILMHASNNFFALLSMIVLEHVSEGGIGEVILTILSILLAVLCPLVIWRFLQILGKDWKQDLQLHSRVPVGLSAGLFILIGFVAVFNLSVVLERLASGALIEDLRLGQIWITT